MEWYETVQFKWAMGIIVVSFLMCCFGYLSRVRVREETIYTFKVVRKRLQCNAITAAEYATAIGIDLDEAVLLLREVVSYGLAISEQRGDVEVFRLKSTQ